VAVDRIVTGIRVQGDFGRRRAPRADEQLDQVVVEDEEALVAGGLDFQQDRPVLGREFGLTAGVGVLEASQGRRAGQRLLGVGGDVGQDLEQGVLAEVLGVIKIRVAGQDLVDRLGEEGFGGMVDELGRARVGEAGGQVGDDAQRALEGADGQEAGIGNQAAAVEGDA